MINYQVGGLKSAHTDKIMFTWRFYFCLTDNLNTSGVETHTVASGRSVPNISEIQNRIKEILSKYRNGVWLSKIAQVYEETYREELSTTVLRQLEHWPHVCTVSIEYHFFEGCQHPSNLSAHLPNVFLICSSLKKKIQCLWNNTPKNHY